MSFYHILLFIHIISAIIGIGPGFVMTRVITNVETMSELRHGFKVRKKIHVFIMIGGTLLLTTGLIMGMMRPSLFREFWYTGSLTLYLIILAAGPLVLAPITKPIKEIMNRHKGDDIPTAYFPLAKRLFFVERITNIFIATIIILMILKPF